MTTPEDWAPEPDQATSPPVSRRALRRAAGASASTPEPAAPQVPDLEEERTSSDDELVDTSTVILTRRELRALRAETGSIPVVPEASVPEETPASEAPSANVPALGVSAAPESSATADEPEQPAAQVPPAALQQPAATAARVSPAQAATAPEPQVPARAEPMAVDIPAAVTTVATASAAATTPTEPQIPASPELAVAPPSRAGRNLPVAIGVGLGLGAAFLASLYFHKELFGILAVAVMVAALLELRAALGRSRVSVPLWPLIVGTVGMFVSAYLVGAEALVVALVVTAGAVVIWCVIDTPGVLALRNASAAVFIAAYIPFLASFLGLALAQPDGEWRVVFIVTLTVACDTGGYAAGVLFGRRPIAPTVSPKKSWEGLAGSFVLTIALAVWLVIELFDAAWWLGVVLGAVAVVAALVGDLAESLIKRDLGIKDMGSVLPGHGGMLDRVDSLLVVAPVVTVLLATLVPA